MCKKRSLVFFFFSSRRRHTRLTCDWSSDVCSSDLITRRTGRPAILERHEHDLVAAQRAAIPGAVLTDRHAVGKARKRPGRHPAQTERGGVAAERIIRLDSLGDHGGIL